MALRQSTLLLKCASMQTGGVTPRERSTWGGLALMSRQEFSSSECGRKTVRKEKADAAKPVDTTKG